MTYGTKMQDLRVVLNESNKYNVSIAIQVFEHKVGDKPYRQYRTLCALASSILLTLPMKKDMMSKLNPHKRVRNNACYLKT